MESVKSLVDQRYFRLSVLSVLIIGASSWAEEGHIEEVLVEGENNASPLRYENLSTVLKDQNINIYSSGGVARIPVMNGLNDDRVKVIVDGIETPSACGNHMNPALSYIDEQQVHQIEVLAGVTPVSMGGDSIAGTIRIESAKPQYATSQDGWGSNGEVLLSNQTNNAASKQSLRWNLANHRWAVSYQGANNRASSGSDGQGDVILDTLYRAENHALHLAHRSSKSEASVRLTHQEIPYQGFPNQYMDMVGNVSDGINLAFEREIVPAAHFKTRLAWQDVRHEMGFFSEEKTGTMPMLTEATTLSFTNALKVLTERERVTQLGLEYHQFKLDDWWPAVEGSMMMGPNEFINIYDGQRDRVALWAEVQQQLAQRWLAQVGLRYEQVTSNTGSVQPYRESMGMTGGMMPMPSEDGMDSTMGNGGEMDAMEPTLTPDGLAARGFNLLDRKRQDNNVDFTASLKYQNETSRVDIGYSQKTRSPNLYERYSWGRGDMAMAMIGWFGDANGYVGNPDLQPEIAHTLAAEYQFGDVNAGYRLNMKAFYSYVDDYIDATVIGTFHPRMSMMSSRNQLMLVNEDAELYGFDIGVRSAPWASSKSSSTYVTADFQERHGERHYDGSNLYQIMPRNLKLALVHDAGSWQNKLEWQWVAAKDDVDPRRLENKTDSYNLVTLSALYQPGSWWFKMALTNLMDEDYALPLGGVSIAQWRADGATGDFNQLKGLGRAMEASVGIQF